MIRKGAWKNRTKTATNAYDLKLEKLKLMSINYKFFIARGQELYYALNSPFKEASQHEIEEMEFVSDAIVKLDTRIMEFK